MIDQLLLGFVVTSKLLHSETYIEEASTKVRAPQLQQANRAAKATLRFPLGKPIPCDLVERIALLLVQLQPWPGGVTVPVVAAWTWSEPAW